MQGSKGSYGCCYCCRCLGWAADLLPQSWHGYRLQRSLLVLLLLVVVAAGAGLLLLLLLLLLHAGLKLQPHDVQHCRWHALRLVPLSPTETQVAAYCWSLARPGLSREQKEVLL